jgi:hypothetical protein
MTNTEVLNRLGEIALFKRERGERLHRTGLIMQLRERTDPCLGLREASDLIDMLDCARWCGLRNLDVHETCSAIRALWSADIGKPRLRPDLATRQLVLICSGGRTWADRTTADGLRISAGRSKDPSSRKSMLDMAAEIDEQADAQEAFARHHLGIVISSHKDSKITVYQGGAFGADRVCDKIAKELGLPTMTFLPEWDRLGKRAGMVRNATMLDEAIMAVGLENVCLFSLPGGKGTMGMRQLAFAKGISYYIAEPTEEDIMKCPLLSHSS